MAASPKTPLARQARLLSKIVKMIRKERNMTGAEIAVAMGVSLRTYQDFEAGRREFDFNKVRLFAKATRSDAVGILLAIHYGWHELAVLLMDNKLASACYILIRVNNGKFERFDSPPPAFRCADGGYFKVPGTP